MTDTAISTADSSFIGTPVPDGAKNIRHYSESGKDKLVLIRFDTADAAAQSFADAFLGGVAPKLGTDPGLTYLGDDLAWWLKSVPVDAIGGEYANPKNNHNHRLLMVPIGNGQKRIWAAVFST